MSDFDSYFLSACIIGGIIFLVEIIITLISDKEKLRRTGKYILSISVVLIIGVVAVSIALAFSYNWESDILGIHKSNERSEYLKTNIDIDGIAENDDVINSNINNDYNSNVSATKAPLIESDTGLYITEPSVSDFEYFQYMLSNGQAIITKYTEDKENVVIPSEIGGYPVTSVGEWAFRTCISLKNIIIPDSVISIGDSAFQDRWFLNEIVIPKSVTSIGNWAFSGCPLKKDITISENVNFIGDGVFSYTGIENITVDENNKYYMSENVNFIGDGVFSYTGIENITVDENNKYYMSENGILFDKNKTVLKYFPQKTKLQHYAIPDSVVSIANYAFSNCSLSNITICENVVSIGTEAFIACSALESITVDTNNKYYMSENGILFDKNKTVLIHYPQFKDVSSGKTSYTIPNGVISIDNGAFIKCILKNITLPNSVTYIGKDAFGNCIDLVNITIPMEVISIGDGAFWYCSNLQSVYFEGDAPLLGEHVFDGTSDDFKIYYKSGTLDWTNPWNGYPTEPY